jgi:hypothetical protein
MSQIQGRILGGLAHIGHSWRSLRCRELGAAVLVALYLGAENLGFMIDFAPGPDYVQSLALNVLQLLLQSLVFLLWWLPAERSEATHPRRLQRLALTVLLGAAVAVLLQQLFLAALLPWLLPLMFGPGGLPSACSACPPHNPLDRAWIALAGDALNVMVVGGLLVAVHEMLSRRRHNAATLQQLLGEQSRYAHEAMAARLSATRAQVDPQQLFDSLLSIERAYAQGDAQAPAQLDHLIAQLRAAIGVRP